MPDNKMLGIVFSNMHDDFLSELTLHRTTASVPFGGRYRLIDFTLSNMVNSGIDRVGIIAKSNYHSLMDHVGSGKEWDLARKRGGLTILPPFSRSGSGIYRGNLEALSGIMGYLLSSEAPYVLLSDCCMVANIDIKSVLEQHKKRHAAMTLLYSPARVINSTQDTVGLVRDSDNWLAELVLHPDIGSTQDVYENAVIIDREQLIHRVNQCVSQNKYSLVHDVLTSLAGTGTVYCHEIKGCSLSVRNMQSYFESNMALLDPKVRGELFNADRPIYTKVRDQVPAKYGLNARVQNSLVADGCIIEGEVKNSIIFRGVRIGKGARVENCILMQDTLVEENASLDYVISDKNVIVTNSRRLAGYLTYPSYLPKGKRI
ncbi:MAG: glucose-1-phosphate adenylyltransferase subunit GlgD [Angelakisella sp.]